MDRGPDGDSWPIPWERSWIATTTQRLQVVAVAEGDCQDHLRALIDRLQAWDRVAVCDFDARRLPVGLCRFGFLYSCHCTLILVRLPCRIGQRYGTLPIGFDAGAIHDCVEHLDAASNHGSGFLFEHFDSAGFLWAMEQAMAFYTLPQDRRASQIRRIMTESLSRFDPDENGKANH